MHIFYQQLVNFNVFFSIAILIAEFKSEFDVQSKQVFHKQQKVAKICKSRLMPWKSFAIHYHCNFYL